MKQLNIFIQNQYIDYLYYVSQNLKFKKVKVYTAVCESDKQSVLSIAVGDDDFNTVKTKLKSLICDVILFAFKEEYLASQIDFKDLSEIYQNTLLKALVLFDCEQDREIINKAINFDNDIHLESLYNFKLKALKHRWQEIVALTNHNKSSFLQSDTFLDLLKFLISTITPKVNLVNVYFNNNRFEFLDASQKKIKSNYIKTGSDELALITTLIALAPENINLHCYESLSDTTFKVLFYIFDEKVNLLV